VKTTFASYTLTRKEKILEIGSGCLRNAFFVQDIGFDVTVIEVNETIKKYQQEYQRFKEKKGKVYANSFPSEKFDWIICTHTLETICPPSNRDFILDMLHAHLKRTGRLLLAVRGVADVKTTQNKGIKCPHPGDGFLTPLNTFIRSFTYAEITAYLFNHKFIVHKVIRGTTERAKIIELVAKVV